MSGAPRFGVIFDNDGVLVDSERYSIAAYRQAIEEQGVVLRPSSDEHYCGLTDADIIADMRQVYGADLDLEKFSSRKRDLYFDLARGMLRPFEGAVGLITELRAAGVPYALASSGSTEKILFNLEQADLAGLFETVITGEDFERGKPDPEIFVRAAERLGLEAGVCAVIEDSVNGLKAARAAGALAVGITNTFAAERLGPHADVLVASLRELDAAGLAREVAQRQGRG